MQIGAPGYRRSSAAILLQGTAPGRLQIVTMISLSDLTRLQNAAWWFRDCEMYLTANWPGADSEICPALRAEKCELRAVLSQFLDPYELGPDCEMYEILIAMACGCRSRISEWS